MIYALQARRLTALLTVLALTAPTFAQHDTAGLGKTPGHHPIQLWPPATTQPAIGEPITIGGWNYRAQKSNSLNEGVPWELIVTPTDKNAEQWQKGSLRNSTFAPMVHLQMQKAPVKVKREADTIPVIVMPQIIWKKWMARDLQDVVGIHFHTLVTDDIARIMFTLHKVPADAPDDDVRATRIEATLISPVIYSLDQTIVVRKDDLHAELVEPRSRHEEGHADVSRQVLLDVLAGPQTWDVAAGKGRHSRLEYFWQRHQIARPWQGYRDDAAKLATLRTSIALVPPTRWSLLLPVPPERVTQKQLQAFNDSIVDLSAAFAKADGEAQAKFHAQHGEFEQAAGP